MLWLVPAVVRDLVVRGPLAIPAAPAFPVPAPPARVDPRDVLSDPQRLVLDFVSANPGCTIRMVAGHLRSSHSTATYHLLSLVRLGLVSQRRDGRELKHFHGATASPAEYLAALARDPAKAKLLDFLATHAIERMSINRIAEAAGVQFGFAKRTLQQLADTGLLIVERRNYRYTIRVGDEFRRSLPELGP